MAPGLPARNNIWLRRQQCPCADRKCYYVTPHDGEPEDSALLASSSKSVNHDDNNCNSNNNNNNNNPSPDDTIFAPYVGMVFDNDNDAFDHYGNFARKHGFSIRKERSRLSPQLGVYKRDFVCYRSGFAPPRKKPNGENPRDRKSLRCGCDAKMYLSKEVANDGVTTQWCVVQFSNIHNHELLEDDQVRLLPAYRKIQEADQERILLLSKAGYPVHRIVKLLELEKRVQHGGGQLPFLERDVRNFIQNRKRLVQESDALLAEKSESDVLELLEACKGLKEGDDDFVYDFDVDNNDKVDRIAWSCRHSVMNYSVFGDVVLFDTSYRSITYGMILGVWFGIDNNGRAILFGCALLSNDTARSYAWVLQTFLRFMKGKYPVTIMTNLDPALREAITCQLPNTKHVIPIWNIIPNLSTWFSHVLGPSYGEFRSEFDVLYNRENTEEFEYQWNQTISRFGLVSDRHIALLFASREAWALCYTRGYFLARMATKSYLKRADAFLKGIFSKQSCLRSFFEQVCHAASFHHQSADGIQFMPINASIPIEEHAQSVFSPFAFNVFQLEVESAMQYASSDMTNGSYLVRHFKGTDEQRLVIYIPDGEEIHCSCKEFESSGILCRHAIRVLIAKNYFHLPEIYFPRRWRHVHYDDQGAISNTGDGWYQEFHDLTSTLLLESSMTKQRSEYAHGQLVKELNRVLDEVRSMPAGDGAAVDFTHFPYC